MARCLTLVWLGQHTSFFEVIVMTAIQTQKRYYSTSEYLELEEVAVFRSEYHDGEIVPMTGELLNTIKSRLIW